MSAYNKNKLGAAWPFSDYCFGELRKHNRLWHLGCESQSHRRVCLIVVPLMFQLARGHLMSFWKTVSERFPPAAALLAL
jgi:hypothetical protein